MSELIKRKSAAAKTFSKIGKTDATAPPPSDSNTFGVAYELFIAESLRSIANARYEAAKDAAIAAGVIQSEYTVGTHIPYNTDGLSIIARRNNDSSTLDKTLLSNILQKDHKFTAADVTKLLDKASKPKKGATTHSFSVEE